MRRTVSLFLISILFLNFPFLAQAKVLEADVLVVGGSQSGVTASIQAARMGSKVVLVSESDWLGGSMIEAGVSAIDGNELLAFQTGLWGEFLNRLAAKYEPLLKYGWVSFFTFDPRVGNQIMKEWISSEPKITWFKNLKPVEVLYDNTKVAGVRFSDGTVVKAKVTVEATELGDLLALGNVPHKLGWEYVSKFGEPSAPSVKQKRDLVRRYPLQEFTWAFFLKDYGPGNKAPKVETPIGYSYKKASERYWCALKNDKLTKAPTEFWGPSWPYRYKTAEKHTQFFTPESFLTYGQVSPDLFMINWPKCANDYSIGIERVFSRDPKDRERFYKEARTYSLWFAKYVQDTLGERYGLAQEVFPAREANDMIAGLAYIPYVREARRLIGLNTLTEIEILPDLKNGEEARFHFDSIAIGNYANDHHYYEMAKPSSDDYFKLAPKSIQWGGRYTGTPFSIPYGVMVPEKIDGLLVAEKSWSVSHIANGSSRLQPVCLLIGQAAGAAAALSAHSNKQPRELKVKDLQAALLNDRIAPPTLIPFYDVKPDNKYRAAIQRLILSAVVPYPKDGNFRPNDLIGEDEFSQWSRRAGMTINKLNQLFPGENFPPQLTRAEAAYLIESQANTLETIPVVESSGQPTSAWKTEKYCATLKQGGNPKSFKFETIKDSNGKPPVRVTPFKSNPANTAGAITFDPEVYDYMRANASKNNKVCFEAAYNNSGAWMLVTKFLQ